MKHIMEPDELDLTVAPAHLTDAEAAEISEFIRQYKSDNKTKAIEVKVTAANEQELAFLLALFRRLNVQWSVSAS